MDGVTSYATDNGRENAGFYRVVFLVNKTNEKLQRNFDSPYLAREFVRKLKHSKRCTLVSAPIF